MSAWGHRFTPASKHEITHGCNSCRGDWATKPRAVVAFEYDYTTGRAGRVSTMRRKLCLHHAHHAADRYGLLEQLNALQDDGFPLVDESPREARDRRLVESAKNVPEAEI